MKVNRAPTRSASPSASTRTPAAICDGEEYSSGRWLTPPRHGMKIIVVGADGGHEKRVVIGAADHAAGREAVGLGVTEERLDQGRITNRGRVLVDRFLGEFETAPLDDRGGFQAHPFPHAFARDDVGVAQVDLHRDVPRGCC